MEELMKKSPIGRERVGITDAARLLRVSVTELKDAIRQGKPVHGVQLPKAILIGAHYQFWLDELMAMELHQR
jgi:hypothetical protein